MQESDREEEGREEATAREGEIIKGVGSKGRETGKEERVNRDETSRPCTAEGLKAQESLPLE